jgi:phospholipase C
MSPGPRFQVSQVAALVLILTFILAVSFAGCRGVGGDPEPGPTIPGTLGVTSSPVKRVIVVMMQNSSFDHLFGTFPGANGPRPESPGFSQPDPQGNPVSPHLLTNLAPPDLSHTHAGFLKMVNGGRMDQFAAVNGRLAMGFYDNSVPGIDKLWGWAQQFALADRFFAPVMGDAPSNQLYLVAATNNEFPFGVQPAFGPCQQPDPASQPFTFPNVGDQLTQKNVSWGWFAENYGVCGSYSQLQNPFQYFTSTQNSIHLQDFFSFRGHLSAGTIPAVSFIQPGGNHTMHPGAGNVTRAAEWLNDFILDVQNSSVWPETAIIVVWDSSGGWYDHVPPPTADSQGFGPRVPMMVISPFAKTNYVSHVQMDMVSILKFIQWNWQLPSLNARNDNSASGDLRDMFSF